MRPLITANVERIDATPFLVAILSGEDGYMLDALIIPYESPKAAIDHIRQLAAAYRIETVEIWTSTNELFVESLAVPGVAGTIKHRSDTAATSRIIEQDREVLAELYGIQPITPKAVPPKWRAFFIRGLRKVLKQLEGDGKYEI